MLYMLYTAAHVKGSLWTTRSSACLVPGLGEEQQPEREWQASASADVRLVHENYLRSIERQPAMSSTLNRP